MIITLTGFMGSGKSSTGRELAALLGCRFVDLDVFIEHKAGMSIPEIFRDSEERFRTMEAEALRDVVIMAEVEGGDTVIALGGGTIMNAESERLIHSRTKCVWLEAELQTILGWLGESDGSRPLYDPVKMKDLYDRRRPVYEKAALRVRTDNRLPAEVAAEIKGLLGL